MQQKAKELNWSAIDIIKWKKYANESLKKYNINIHIKKRV